MTKINFDNGTYFSEKNIWFSNTAKKPVNTSEYDRPLLASNRSGIDNMYLVFQKQSAKNMYESKIINQGDLVRDVWVEKNFGSDADIEEKKPFIKVKQSVVYWPGKHGKSAEDLNI